MNPVELIPPGERGEVVLGPDLVAHVVRGAAPGPIVWAWAPRGDGDPSMAQALGEVRDELHPASMRGALGLLLDGPPPPLVAAPGFREEYPWHAAIRAICRDAAAVVLLESMLPGYQAAPHVACDLTDDRARRVARALGARFLAPPLVVPTPSPSVVTAPSVLWLDGEAERLERPVVDRAARALRSLFATLGMIDAPPSTVDTRIVLRAIAEVEAGGPGLVEIAVPPGAIVRAGEVVAWVGAPGLRSRRALRAPSGGVVLYARGGLVPGGRVVGIGKLRRTLPELAARAPARELVTVGWCETVALPELGVSSLPAKIDTGARTSALHVASLREEGWTGDGRPLVALEVPTGVGDGTTIARAPIAEYTWVRDSSGHAARRPVIETTLRLGPIESRVRVSLTDRGDMSFPMLVGRTALAGRARVDPGRRFLLGGGSLPSP
jgi:hypothetical protein